MTKPSRSNTSRAAGDRVVGDQVAREIDDGGLITRSYVTQPSEFFVHCNGATYPLYAEPAEIPAQTIVLVAGTALLGQFVVGIFNWRARQQNVVYKTFELVASPFVKLIRLVTPKVVLDRKASLMASMDAVAKEDGADQVLLFVVDILREEATLLVPNDLVKQMAEASFGCTVTGDTVVLPGVMSRKKQIIPALKL